MADKPKPLHGEHLPADANLLLNNQAKFIYSLKKYILH